MADPTIQALFVAKSLNDAAPEDALTRAEWSLGRDLPPDYRAFLATSDGYDDVVGQGHLTLWPCGQLMPRNEAFEVARQLTDVVLIGSNNEGAVYGIDWAGGTPQFIRVPFAAMQRSDVRVLGASFRDFVEAVARGEGR
jgi:hypothetical protein